MKASLVAIICICVALVCIPLSCGFQSVGEDFGTSWLDKYGTKPVSTLEIANNLWNWGNAPKGFGLHDGVLYPPGTEPQWYYPTSYSDYTPIIINRTDSKQFCIPECLKRRSLAALPALGKACGSGQRAEGHSFLKIFHP